MGEAPVAARVPKADLDRIPVQGPVLLVGNHSGGNLPPDTFVCTLAFISSFGVERPRYQLAHSLVVSMPGLGALRRFGTVVANHENATLAMQSDGRGRFRLRDAGEGRARISFRLAYQAPGGLLGLVADRVAARQVGRIMDTTVKQLEDLTES